jgi:hypothetical protein
MTLATLGAPGILADRYELRKQLAVGGASRVEDLWSPGPARRI